MPVTIHGKDYITVNERVQEFHDKYPNGSIRTELIEMSDRFIIQAKVIPEVENEERYFTGLAYEVIGSTQINKTSALENCVTSAVGRALGMLNLGITTSIASADEVANAVEQQKYTVTNEQKEEFDKLKKHPVFVGQKNDLNNWFKKFQREEEAAEGLKKMSKKVFET